MGTGKPTHTVSRICSGQDQEAAKYQRLHFHHLLEARVGSVRDHPMSSQAPRGLSCRPEADRVRLLKDTHARENVFNLPIKVSLEIPFVSLLQYLSAFPEWDQSPREKHKKDNPFPYNCDVPQKPFRRIQGNIVKLLIIILISWVGGGEQTGNRAKDIFLMCNPAPTRVDRPCRQRKIF